MGISRKQAVWKTYTNNQRNFSFKYPFSWEIKTEGGDYFIILIPSKEKSWNPEKPKDIPKNPEIKIVFGKYVREILGPENFPETITLQILENWLGSKTSNNGVSKNFSKRTINKFQALEIIEMSIPGCSKVVYWRATSLNDLIRIETGCESEYLDEFNQIVNTLKQIN